MPNLHKVLSKCSIGDELHSGNYSWTVIKDKSNYDCVVATPNWKEGDKPVPPFELWDDAQSQITEMKYLKRYKNT